MNLTASAACILQALRACRARWPVALQLFLEALDLGLELKEDAVGLVLAGMAKECCERLRSSSILYDFGGVRKQIKCFELAKSCGGHVRCWLPMAEGSAEEGSGARCLGQHRQQHLGH